MLAKATNAQHGLLRHTLAQATERYYGVRLTRQSQTV